MAHHHDPFLHDVLLLADGFGGPSGRGPAQYYWTSTVRTLHSGSDNHNVPGLGVMAWGRLDLHCLWSGQWNWTPDQPRLAGSKDAPAPPGGRLASHHDYHPGDFGLLSLGIAGSGPCNS